MGECCLLVCLRSLRWCFRFVYLCVMVSCVCCVCVLLALLCGFMVECLRFRFWGYYFADSVGGVVWGYASGFWFGRMVWYLLTCFGISLCWYFRFGCGRAVGFMRVGWLWWMWWL